MGRPLASGSSFHPGRRLMAAATVLTLVFGTALALLLWTGYRDDTSRTRDATEALARSAAFSTETFLADRIRILNAIARSEIVRSGDRQATSAYFRRLRPGDLSFTGGIALIDGDGRTVPTTPGAAPVDVSDRDYVRVVLARGTPYVSRAVVGRVRGVPVVVVAVPVRTDGNAVSGVLAGVVRLDILSALQALQPAGASLQILDRGGQLIFDDGPIRELRVPPNRGLIAEMRGDADGGLLDRVEDLTGRDDRLLGFDSAPTGRWLVVAERSADTAYAAATRKLRTGLVLLVVAAALALVGAALIGLRLDRLARSGEQARAQAERRRRDAERLHRLAASIAASIDVSEVMEVTIRQAVAELRADAGAIYLVDDAHGEPRLVSWPGFAESVDHEGRVPLEVQVTGADAVASGSGVYLESGREIAARYPELTPMTSGDGPAWATLPLFGGGHALGVLFLRFASRRRFDEGERRFLQTLAEQTAVGLGRALLHHSTEAAERGARLLAEVAAAMEEEETFELRAARLVDVVVATLADFATVEVADGESTAGLVALATTEPDQAPTLRELRTLPAVDGDERTLTAPLDPTGSFVREDADLAPGRAGDDRARALLRALRPLTFASLPLRGRAGTLGGLLIGTTAGSGRALTRHDLPLLVRLAERAGLALENAMLYERERAVAGLLQQSLLPADLPALPGVELASAYVAGSEGVEVGGDFYDAFLTPGGPVLVIGDVCGRGAEAASMTALCRYTLRAAALEEPSSGPSHLLEVLNRAILAQLPENTQFCTVTVARLARREDGSEDVTLASAAHPPALCVRRDGSVEPVEALGGLMGVFPASTFPETTLTLAPGDAVLLYTDGVVEARAGTELFGEERLLEVVRRLGETSADGMVKRVLTAIDDHAAGRLVDDVALLCLRNHGTRERAAAPDPLDLTLIAGPASLAPMRTSLRAWLDEAAVDDDAGRDVVLACNEAVANAVRHAYGASGGEVHVRATLEEGEVVLEVRDDGAWRPSDGDVRPYDEHGRGFLLMQAVMDDVHVDRRPDGTTVVLRRAVERVPA